MNKQIVSVIFSLFTLALLIPGCKKDEKPPAPVADFEGNSYKTVKIGAQIWMAENLKATKYKDGSAIALISAGDNWSNLTSPGYCWYNNDEASFKNTYGALYNGYTINTGKLCPDGWHIPSTDELRVLREFVGDSTKSGGKLKESGTSHWLAPNKGATNSSGFTALPAGIRYFEGTFASNQSYAGIWSATATGHDYHDSHDTQDEEWYISLYYADASFILDHRNKKYGFSVRCLKD
jgi:uncharacterized protein (TIGR02145 family)